ncbi:MAG: elongation factor P hydroxylase [Alcanivoracaceae bacterium]|nr:elongation factor P hydroxylase [Alcanivoracaceae bacterium]
MTGATLTQTADHWHAGFSSADLEQLFAQCFGAGYQTCLSGGHDEPFYQPARDGQPARLCYRADFFRSALHEVAHWCIAGPARRQQTDFGYWYEPDGRSVERQQAFLMAEVRPQAFELVFCAAAGHRFSVSLDNLGGEACGDVRSFEARVCALAEQLLVAPPARMAQWGRCLSAYYRGVDALPDRSMLAACFQPIGDLPL